jgi:phage tail sheath gpL-like
MTASLNLTVNASRAELNDFVKSSTDPRGESLALSNLFKKLASGAISGSIIAQKAAVAAVRASGTITTIYADLAANDTVTIAGITITCVTGTPSGFTQWKKVTDLATTSANLAAAINGLTTLNIYVSATSAAGVVTITANQAGVVGNLITLAKNAATPTGLAVSAAALASGAGGASSAPVTYSRGL